ncbi:hypothetical protein [Moraxella lacunata]|nr:hypothetical protein [Moraxella lacunata]
MKKLLFSMALCLTAPLAVAAPADWSGLFKSWEDGCNDSKALAAFTNSLSLIDVKANGQFYLTQDIDLPKKYRNQAAKNVSFHKIWDACEQHHFDQTRLALTGHYYGLPVVHYSQTFMLETAGVEYRRLLLNAPIEQARRVLAGKYRPRKHFNPVLEGHETLRAELLPVTINGKAQTVLECAYVFG